MTASIRGFLAVTPGLIDFWLEAILDLHQMYRPRDEVPPPQGDAPEGVGDGWWVRYAPRAPTSVRTSPLPPLPV